jgi:hypothetical protein
MSAIGQSQELTAEEKEVFTKKGVIHLCVSIQAQHVSYPELEISKHINAKIMELPGRILVSQSTMIKVRENDIVSCVTATKDDAPGTP